MNDLVSLLFRLIEELLEVAGLKAQLWYCAGCDCYYGQNQCPVCNPGPHYAE